MGHAFRRPPLVWFTIAGCLWCPTVAREPAAAGAPPRPLARDAYRKEIAPLLAKYCGACHGQRRQEADIAFHSYPDVASVIEGRETWEKTREALEQEIMPPDDKPQPAAAERQRLIQWIKATLQFDCSQARDPGRVTIRRLNRAEYDNTLRDLLGIDLKLAHNFPSDDVGEGFDNIGDVLSLPPLLLERYMEAAEQAARAAIVVTPAGNPPESHRRIVVARPGAGKTAAQAATEVLERFAARAYRRPVAAGELQPLVQLVERVLAQGAPYERALQVAVAAALVSPHFLYRVELDPAPDDPQQIRPLNDFELASRLSYFLWSTMPDEELFRLAGQGALRRDAVLLQQTRRMLADPRAEALVRNFGAQWLNLRLLDDVTRDRQRFGTFDDRLRRDMQRETELFFTTVMREDRSILDFLKADFTFANERLAKHYGLSPPLSGDDFQRVSLPAGQRLGVLTHASVLTLTSNPTRTSPVKRGKWIMENILGTPPPEPPANVPPLEATQKATPQATLREQMVLHRQDPGCASCHRVMDDLGFGFENFDAIGRWRDRDGGRSVDASGELPGGQRFAGPTELIRILSDRQEQFARTLTRKMLTYGLGRGLEYYDVCAVHSIVDQLKQHDHRFSVLVTGIVTSDPFRMRRGDGGKK